MNTFSLSYNSKNLLLMQDINIIFDISNLNKIEINDIKNLLYSEYSFLDKNVITNSKIINNKYYGNSICIIPSNKCQLGCKYCYSESWSINKNNYVDINKIKKLIDTFVNNDNLYKYSQQPVLKFLFHGGGEPTYNWELFKEIIKYIIQNKNSSYCKIILKLVTNGIANEKNAIWLAKNFDEITFSIDGFPELNNTIRPFKNGEKSTQISIKSAKIASNYTNVGIHSVVTALSKGKGKSITEYFMNEVNQIAFIDYEKFKETVNGRNEVLSISNPDFIDFIFDALSVNSNIVHSAIIDTKRKHTFCKGCSGNIIYCFPNNNISICNEHDNGKYVIGNYIEKLSIDSDKIKLIKNDFSLLYKKLDCENCFAFSYCKGGCKSYYEQCNDYRNQWCELYKEALLKLFSIKLNSDEAKKMNYKNKIISYCRLD